MTQKKIRIDPWPEQGPKDARKAVALYSDIACALEHVTPSLALLNASSVSQGRRDAAVSETDNIALELRRARSILLESRCQDYLKIDNMIGDIKSALTWYGVMHIERGASDVKEVLEAISRVINPILKFHGLKWEELA